MECWASSTSGSWRCLFLWDWSYIRGYWVFFPTVRILISYTSISKSRRCILLELCTSKQLESCSKNSSLAFSGSVHLGPVVGSSTRFISEGRGLCVFQRISLCQSCDFLFLRDLRGSTKDLKNKWVVVVCLDKAFMLPDFDSETQETNKGNKALIFDVWQCFKESEFLLSITISLTLVDYRLMLTDNRSYADLVLTYIPTIYCN